MAYHIILEHQQNFLKQDFPTQELAQSFLDNSDITDGVVVDTDQLQDYIRRVNEWRAQQEQPQQESFQQDSYGPDQSEEAYLEQNRQHNQYCRDRKLLFSPKREEPIWKHRNFNQRPAGHSFRHPPINPISDHPHQKCT